MPKKIECPLGCEDGLNYKPFDANEYDACLGDDENNAEWSCGCLMHRCDDGSFTIHQCAMHKNAEDLLAAAKKLLNDWGKRNLTEAVQGLAAMVTESEAKP